MTCIFLVIGRVGAGLEVLLENCLLYQSGLFWVSPTFYLGAGVHYAQNVLFAKGVKLLNPLLNGNAICLFH